MCEDDRMSGIFGFFTNNGELKKDMNIEPMLLWNRPYGRDGEECYEDAAVSMGCCLELLSDKFIQPTPVIISDGVHAVIDAILYDREELIIKCRVKADLSDAELLLRYIEQFGPDSLKNVNGDFSGAIYYDRTGTLLIFRDHMGIRPLFYYASDDLVAFSTDLRGLIALSGVDASISEDWIYQTVSGFSADTIDNTPYRNILCVPPASYIRLSFIDRALVIRKRAYWKLRSRMIKLPSEKEYTDSLRELITDSVQCRLNAVSGPVGAELSGGLDSGVIDILINRAGREGIFYSWSFDPSELKIADNDERLIINDICRQENIVCSFTHIGEDYVERIAKNMNKLGLPTDPFGSGDLRFAFPTWSNTYSLLNGALYAAEHGSKVIFTGHGGDEGVSHRCSAYEMFYNREYYRYLRCMWSTTHGQKNRIFKTLSKNIRLIHTKKKEGREPFLSWYASPELLNPDFAASKSVKDAYTLRFEYDPINYIETGGSRNRLDNIALYGALSGVRYMVPFLDYRVIDFAVSIPRHLFLKGRVNRYIYREAFKNIMPDSLYRLNAKEDTSINNLPPNPDWYESYAARKAEIINSLDREFWGKYLNFEEIDKLAATGKPSEDEYEDEIRRLKALLICSLAHNLIKKARSTP